MTQSEPVADRKCTAPVKGGCPLPHYSDGLCEAHWRRRYRSEDADLSRPVRPRSMGPTYAISARLTESAYAFYVASHEGEYARASSVLEAFAQAALRKMTQVERAELNATASVVLARKASTKVEPPRRAAKMTARPAKRRATTRR